MFSMLYLHPRGASPTEANHTVEQMFNYNVRFQVLCRNQEEKDYLQALCLVHGRQLQVDVWDEWDNRPKKPFMTLGDPSLQVNYMQEGLLPIVYTTFPIDLRGYR